MTNKLREHWERIYRSRSEAELSWHSDHLYTSLRMIRDASRGDKSAAIIDVGGGTSRLVDDLLADHYSDITVLDIASASLKAVRARLGKMGETVKFLNADILEIGFSQPCFDIWHDRAVFHFLTSARDREKYIEVVRKSLRPGGTVILATFGPAGPEKCSGLDVFRYDPVGLKNLFGDDFSLIEGKREIHLTPWGAQQEFTYCMARFEPADASAAGA